MSIGTHFQNLVPPLSTDIDALHATILPGSKNARIAINRLGYPAILLSNLHDFPLTNFRLKYLEISIRRSCSITINGQTTTEDFVLILFRSTDTSLTKYFFSIIDTFLSTLANATTSSARRGAFDSLLDIFRSLNDEPLSTVQGLWSELFVICQSKNVPLMLTSWHLSPSDRFDFVLDAERLEVKSSKTMSRIHTFAAYQLLLDAGTLITVASLFVIESLAGCSMQKLKTQIDCQLSDPELRQKLERCIAKTLGRGISQSMHIEFDLNVAKTSLCFFDAAEVPKIDAVSIPSKVTDVHYKSDLSQLMPLNNIELKMRYLTNRN